MKRPAFRNGEDSITGFLLALAAYLFWGALPLYLKLMDHIPAAEVVAHRVIWSVPIAGMVLIALGKTSDLRASLSSPRMVMQAMLTAMLISINWGTYVWAISADRTVDAALGYYINPIFSVLLGAILLKESLNPFQIGAVLLSIIAVGVLTYETGYLPWVAIVLTFSWGFYAFFRKTLPIGPNQGFLLEVLILLIPSSGYIAYLHISGESHFAAATGLRDTFLLMGGGLVTALPLMIYANAAKRLRLSTIGMMQYIAPTFILLIAIFIFNEPFPWPKRIAFGLIWTALALYSTSMLRPRRKLTH